MEDSSWSMEANTVLKNDMELNIKIQFVRLSFERQIMTYV